MDYTNEVLTTRQLIQVAAEHKNIRLQKIAEGLGISVSNFSNKMRQDNFRDQDLKRIADILGYDMFITFREREETSE